MKRALFLLMITLMFGTAFAQPKQRRVQKSEQQQQSLPQQETESAEEPFFFDVCACPDILPYGSGYARRGGVAS